MIRQKNVQGNACTMILVELTSVLQLIKFTDFYDTKTAC